MAQSTILTTAPEMPFERFRDLAAALAANVEQVVAGKHEQVRLAVTCLLAEGHLLIEDVPGVGKTSLARALADSIDGTLARIQFTSDSMPADITGVTVYHPGTGLFQFHEGPVFANLVIADEVNRASPKTQSALLEVMAERQVTVDGTARPTARPFMVLATQNPIGMEGTYPLPEAQLDRFLMRIAMGYPDEASELAILAADREGRGPAERRAGTVLTAEQVAAMTAAARRVHVGAELARYVVRLAAATRERAGDSLGVSPRGAVALQRAVQVWAAVDGRDHVHPDDVRGLAPYVFTHRILLGPAEEADGRTAADVVTDALATVPVPRHRTDR
ncbi:MoxR-like ATPase [Actinoplanes philippinensis]|uniref:MoxR-like ATPase n=1 Tax=Actinoplanes philippinensis TaxID=35752 RepID=A0A1I2HWJ9_9ACTN|nr:MoxR family ATPase [Actinoplanes philippinensis]GIE78921.1 MoxR-like ATPase [Actinoplanes philippinensis]SFF34202.1 MoxR-like ATPase [Actinoplanes philippinensis]